MSSEIEGAYRGILALLAASEEGIRGRARAQKFAYLAGFMGAADFSRVKFKHYGYGPYSRRISDCLHWLVVAGLVEEIQEKLEDDLTQYTYCLTEDGKSWIEQNKPKEFAILKQIVSKLADADISALELAATARFLQQKEKTDDVESAFQEAINRNPDREKFKAKAKQLTRFYCISTGSFLSLLRHEGDSFQSRFSCIMNDDRTNA